MKTASEEGLNRVIGTKSLAASVINSTIGAGIFVVPALVVDKMGGASALPYIICGVLIALIMLGLAEVGGETASSGGIYAYVGSAFGPFAGFLTSNLYWIGFGLVSDAAIANALFEMIAVNVKQADTLTWRCIFFLSVFGVLSWINIRGVKQGARLISLLTVAKLLPIAVLLVVAWPEIDFSRLLQGESIEVQSLGAACLILFFAFVGGEAALTNGGEFRNPKQTVPNGLFIGIGTVVLVYLTIFVITHGVLGSSQSNYQDSPLTQVAKLAIGDNGAVVVIVATALAITGAISGDILTMPRFLFAASKDKLLPEMLSAIHSRFRTPHIAILSYSFFAFVLSLSGSFKALAILSSSANLITYFIVMLSLWKLKRKKADGAVKANAKMPVFLIPPVLLTILWILSYLTAIDFLALAVFFAISTLYFFRRPIIGWIKNLTPADEDQTS